MEVTPYETFSSLYFIYTTNVQSLYAHLILMASLVISWGYHGGNENKTNLSLQSRYTLSKVQTISQSWSPNKTEMSLINHSGFRVNLHDTFSTFLEEVLPQVVKGTCLS